MKELKIITPHCKKSREVIEKDLNRVRKAIDGMVKLCNTPIGMFQGGYAVAHCQVEKKDPLKFFVTNRGEVIINPVITRHTNQIIKKKEGCLSYADKGMIEVDRYNKCEVDYTTLDEFPKIIKGKIDGINSQIFQHEIQHFDGDYIFKDILPKKKFRSGVVGYYLFCLKNAVRKRIGLKKGVVDGS